MSILALQNMMVTYLRDEAVRERFAEDKAAAIASFNLSPREQELAAQVNFDVLAETLKQVYKERFDGRSEQFLHFYGIMRQCGEFDKLFAGFLRTYTEGAVDRKTELERFREYALDYVRENSLPEALLDLVQYSYNTNFYSYAPKEDGYNAGDLDPDRALHLKRPYKVEEMKYDVLLLADNTEVTSFAEVEAAAPQRPHRIFFQKSYTDLLSCNIFEVDDPEFFELLEKGASVHEIIAAAASPEQAAEWEEIARDLYEAQVLGHR